jgi:hypothetical protein
MIARAEALLRRLDEAAARPGESLPPDVAAYVRQALAHWRAGQPFALAWGIAGRPGQRRGSTIERLASRDRAIRELRWEFFGDLQITPAAAAIASAVRGRRSGRGHRDGAVDDQRRLIEAVRQCGKVPAARRILDILRSELPPIHCVDDRVAGPEI